MGRAVNCRLVLVGPMVPGGRSVGYGVGTHSTVGAKVGLLACTVGEAVGLAVVGVAVGEGVGPGVG